MLTSATTLQSGILTQSLQKQKESSGLTEKVLLWKICTFRLTLSKTISSNSTLKSRASFSLRVKELISSNQKLKRYGLDLQTRSYFSI